MITLNTDIYLLCSLFNISRQKITNQYTGMTVEEIMQAEAAQGNSAAANFDSTILDDPVKLIQLFKLKDPSNKFAILSNMNEDDLKNILPLLSEEDLLIGLNYFTKDQLLKLSEALPKEQLLKLTFEMFSPEQLMQIMPEDQLNKILTSIDLDKNMVIRMLPELKPQILAQMYEGATGQAAPQVGNSVGLDGSSNYNASQLVQSIIDLPDDKFKEALLSIPPANKQAFVLKLAKENPKLFQAIDSDAFINIIKGRKDKDDIIRSASVLDKDSLIGMIRELPKDLTAAVLTQIDPEKLAGVLISSFRDILRQIVAG